MSTGSVSDDRTPAQLRGDARFRAIFIVVAVLVPALAGAWVISDRMRLSWGGDRWLARATSDAKAWAGDAELISIHGEMVNPTGLADVRRRGRWSFQFRSPSRENTARIASDPVVIPGAPPSTPESPTCRYSVSIFAGLRGGYMMDHTEHHVEDRFRPSLPSPPACSIQQVWKRAIAKGAPDPGFAEIELITTTEARAWTFRINRNGTAERGVEPLFRTSFADDCSPAPTNP